MIFYLAVTGLPQRSHKLIFPGCFLQMMNGLLFSSTNFLLYIYITPLPLLLPLISLHFLFSCFVALIPQPNLYSPCSFYPTYAFAMGFSLVPAKAGHLLDMQLPSGSFKIKGQAQWTNESPANAAGQKDGPFLEQYHNGKARMACFSAALCKQTLKPRYSQHLKPLSFLQLMTHVCPGSCSCLYTQAYEIGWLLLTWASLGSEASPKF